MKRANPSVQHGRTADEPADLIARTVDREAVVTVTKRTHYRHKSCAKRIQLI
jgi:hypothetical protein